MSAKEKILILDNGTGVARVTLNDGTKRFALLRMPRVVELHPKLRDEADLEIEGAQYPLALPASNEMVERDPGANLPDASGVRIAWREIKVETGKSFAGKTVEWPMEPIFTPWHATAEHPEGEPEAAPRLRETSPAFLFLSLAAKRSGLLAPGAQRSPGFNKARVRIEIDGRPPLDLLDLEVPAAVVIDPGHGTGFNMFYSFGKAGNGSSTALTAPRNAERVFGLPPNARHGSGFLRKPRQKGEIL
jgi:hypothetical protein